MAEAIEKSLVLGNTPKAAAELAGITERTFYNWMDRGQEDERAGRTTVFGEFFQRTTRALAQAEQALVVLPLAKAARSGNIRAAQFLATHRFGWSSTMRTEVSGPDGGPIEQRDVSGSLSGADLRDALREARRIAAAIGAADDAARGAEE